MRVHATAGGGRDACAKRPGNGERQSDGYERRRAARRASHPSSGWCERSLRRSGRISHYRCGGRKLYPDGKLRWIRDIHEGGDKYVQVRGTEPRLTNTTIDGINVPSPESGVRQIKFDAIPADIVESVEINKTLQANMDGDGIGGSINLVTKTAGERPSISVSGMGGHTPIVGGRNLVETAGTVGQRFGTDKKFGLLIGGTYDWNGRGIDDLEPVPDIATLAGGSTARYFEAIDIREYRYYRSRWGLAGSGDYKLGDGSNIYFRALYSDFHNYGDRWVYSFTDNTPGILLEGSNGCATDPVTGVTVQP